MKTEIYLDEKHLINKELFYIEQVPERHPDRMNDSEHFDEEDTHIPGSWMGYHLRLVFKDKSEIWITGCHDTSPTIYEVKHKEHEIV